VIHRAGSHPNAFDPLTREQRGLFETMKLGRPRSPTHGQTVEQQIRLDIDSYRYAYNFFVAGPGEVAPSEGVLRQAIRTAQRDY
jgi:hypothetical protein